MEFLIGWFLGSGIGSAIGAFLAPIIGIVVIIAILLVVFVMYLLVEIVRGIFDICTYNSRKRKIQSQPQVRGYFDQDGVWRYPGATPQRIPQNPQGWKTCILVCALIALGAILLCP